MKRTAYPALRKYSAEVAPLVPGRREMMMDWERKGRRTGAKVV